MSDELTLDQKQDVLAAMFGEGPAQSAVQEYASTIGRAIQSGARTIGGSGKVMPIAGVAAPAIVTPSAAQPRGHTFYGSTWMGS